MHPVRRRAKQVREVGAVESMPQVQLADFPVNGVHPGKRTLDVIHRAGRLVEPRRRDGGPQPRVALVAGQREQPRPQPVGLS